MFKHVEELFPLLLKTLSDPSDEVSQYCELVLKHILKCLLDQTKYNSIFLGISMLKAFFLYSNLKNMILLKFECE